MLDIKFVRSNSHVVQEALANRGTPLSLSDFLRLDERRRGKLVVVEQLKNKRNVVSEEIGRLKKEGLKVEDMVLEMRHVSGEIKELDDEIRAIDDELAKILLGIPNLPHESVPVGRDEGDNLEVRRWGERRIGRAHV